MPRCHSRHSRSYGQTLRSINPIVARSPGALPCATRHPPGPPPGNTPKPSPHSGPCREKSYPRSPDEPVDNLADPPIQVLDPTRIPIPAAEPDCAPEGEFPEHHARYQTIQPGMLLKLRPFQLSLITLTHPLYGKFPSITGCTSLWLGTSCPRLSPSSAALFAAQGSTGRIHLGSSAGPFDHHVAVIPHASDKSAAKGPSEDLHNRQRQLSLDQGHSKAPAASYTENTPRSRHNYCAPAEPAPHPIRAHASW